MSVIAASASPSLLAQNRAQAAAETFTDEGSATLANLSLQDFQWLIGERFSISSASQKLGKITLIAATELDPFKPSRIPQLADQAISGFQLRFQGAGGTLPQDTYILQQGSMGKFPLLLVPEGPGANQGPAESSHPTYLAVFTRLANAAQYKPTTPAQ
jgi:hypothetical protein